LAPDRGSAGIVASGVGKAEQAVDLSISKDPGDPAVEAAVDRLTAQQQTEIIALYERRGLGIYEVAERVGVDHMVVWRLLRRYNLGPTEWT
jgi:transcriptional regulator of acetoin/glycerol metabolism